MEITVLVILACISSCYCGPLSVHKDDLILENPDLFEGDILGIDPHQDRNAIPKDEQRWPNGRVPYQIDPYTTYDEKQLELIKKAMAEYESKTCIRFVEKDEDEKDFILIFAGRGCYSKVGKTGGVQALSFGNNCFQLPTLVHELGHSLGFYHEHTRSDRDDYITIHWSQIMESTSNHTEVLPKTHAIRSRPGPSSMNATRPRAKQIVNCDTRYKMNRPYTQGFLSTQSDRLGVKFIGECAKDQFYKLSPSENRLLDPFDYDSIMLYGERTFSKDGWTKTMTAKEAGRKLVDVYDKKGLSDSDVRRIKKLYQC